MKKFSLKLFNEGTLGDDQVEMPSTMCEFENSVAFVSAMRLGSFRTLPASGSWGTDEAYRYTVGFTNDSWPL